MRKSEIISGLFIILGTVLMILSFPGKSIAFILGFGILGIAYQFLSFAILNRIPIRKAFKKNSYISISTQRILASVFTGFALATAVYGILFKLMFWPGAGIMLFDAVVFLLITAIIFIAKSAKNPTTFFKDVITRVAIFLILSISIYAIPTEAIIKLQYRNDPEYCQALTNVMRHPRDLKCQAKLQELKRKRALGQ